MRVQSIPAIDVAYSRGVGHRLPVLNAVRNIDPTSIAEEIGWDVANVEQVESLLWRALARPGQGAAKPESVAITRFAFRGTAPNLRLNIQSLDVAVVGDLMSTQLDILCVDRRHSQPEPSSLGHHGLVALLPRTGPRRGGSRDSGILSSVRSPLTHQHISLSSAPKNSIRTCMHIFLESWRLRKRFGVLEGKHEARLDADRRKVTEL